MRYFRLALMVVALTCSAGASTFVIGLDHGGHAIVFSQSSPTPISGSITEASARAGATVGARTDSVGGFFQVDTNSADGNSNITDLFLAGPMPGSQVNVTVNLPYDVSIFRHFESWADLNGDQLESTEENSFHLNMLGGAFVDLHMSTDSGSTLNSSNCTTNFQIGPSSTQLEKATVNGVPWAGQEIDQAFFLSGICTMTYTYTVGAFNQLQFDVLASTVSSGQAVPGLGANGSSTTNALNTFGIPTGVSVFTVPAGYSLSSDSIGLVDGIIPGAPAAVPEPATMTLVASALVGLAGRKFARRRG